MSYCTGSSGYSQRSSSPACAATMTLSRRRRTLRVMGIKSVARLPRCWLDAAGVALVTALAVVGAYVEANPVHRYGGLHLTSHPPLAVATTTSAVTGLIVMHMTVGAVVIPAMAHTARTR